MSRRERIPHVLLLIDTSRAYGRGLVEGIARYADEHGPWSIYFNERSLMDSLPRWLTDWCGDGIISHTARKLDVEKLFAKTVPVVELFPAPKSGIPLVRPDEEGIARQAVEHFLDRGLRHFAFFCADSGNWIDWRRQAFEQYLHSRDMSCHVFPVPSTQRTGKRPRLIDDRRVVRWLRELPEPCGLLCATDSHAVQLTRCCRTRGILVPEQIAVLGVDNDPVLCAVCFPRLSSIELGSARIGYEAAALLDRMIRGRSRPKRGVCIEPQGVIARESTDILAIDDLEMAQAVRMIREKSCRHLRVAQLAEDLGLSRRAFEQRFQKALHRNPKAEIVRYQMERAKSMLSNTDLPMSKLAKECGFTSMAYFSRAFRRQFGLTPRDYRKRHRLSDDFD
jgi:LacI family transcriptional regulator